MRVIYISTYPPRRCGIGTFSNNLVRAVHGDPSVVSAFEYAWIVALNDEGEEYDYDDEVKFTIRANHQKDYIQAARFINYSGADWVVLQHEFGIFGGEMGVYILSLLNHLQLPLLVVFHTVLKNPSYIQRSIIAEIAKIASHVIVMSYIAFSFLENIYKIPRKKIHVIEHGTPVFSGKLQQTLKKQYHLEDKKVILTFGLINRNKGIETVLHALSRVVSEFPEVLYIVLGRTHPTVIKLSGEEYREYLKMLIKRYKIEENVFLYDQFVSEDILIEYLSMADVYVTPYLTEEQITSGTLSYAIGAGNCVVSTPYWHAKELLAKGRGILFDFKDDKRLSDILLDLFKHPEKLKKIRKKAYKYSVKFHWPKIGKIYSKFFTVYRNNPIQVQLPGKYEIDLAIMPRLDLLHVKRLTDGTGIVQFAKYGIPNLKGGYCLTDNARAVLMTTMYYHQRNDHSVLELLSKYLSYLHFMQNSDGTFHNLLTFDRRFLDERGTEDAFGKAIWALGYLVHFKPNDAFKQITRDLFERSINQFDILTSLRGISSSMIGLSYFLQEYSEKEYLNRVLLTMTQKLVDSFHSHAAPDWNWFESKLTYDNGLLPLALLRSDQILENETAREVARKSIAFLIQTNFSNEYFTPVGNKGWYVRAGIQAEYDQQSSEAMSMITLLFQAYQTFKDRKYLKLLFKCYSWYLGENEFHIPVYDHESGGCYEGLIYKGVNKNEGAESTLSYIISHLVVLKAHELEQMI